MKLRRDVFQAIADPTRRAILLLVASPALGQESHRGQEEGGEEQGAGRLGSLLSPLNRTPADSLHALWPGLDPLPFPLAPLLPELPKLNALWLGSALTDRVGLAIEGTNLLRTLRTGYYAVDRRPESAVLNDRQISLTLSLRL